MLIIKVKDGENIDRALKRYRRKFRDTKVMRELRDRREFTKESVRRRAEVKKAQYRESVFLSEDN
jgi:small subunit ribosomal protein S21